MEEVGQNATNILANLEKPLANAFVFESKSETTAPFQTRPLKPRAIEFAFSRTAGEAARAVNLAS